MGQCGQDNILNSEETVGGGAAHIQWAGDDTCGQDSILSSEETMGGGTAHIQWAGDDTLGMTTY